MSAVFKRVSVWACSLALTGCNGPLSGVCDQGGVAPGLTIELRDAEGPGEHPRPGEYEFKLSTEFGEVAWSCTIAADDRVGAGCAADRIVRGEESQALLISAVAGEEQFWISLTLIEGEEWSGPEAVHLEVMRDGAPVVDERLAPSYALSPYSGNEGCALYFVAEGDPPQLEL